MAKNHEVSWIGSEASRRAKSAVAVALSFAIVIGGLGFGGWKAYGLYMSFRQQTDYIGDGKDPVQVVIPDGTSIGGQADILVAADVIKSPAPYEAISDTQYVQPGTYSLKTQLPAATAVDMLLDAKNRVVVKVTIPEGARWTSIVPILEQNQMTEDQINAAWAKLTDNPASFGLDPAVVGDYPEGFLFPDTYVLNVPPDPLDLLHQAVGEFISVATSLDMSDQAANLTCGTDPCTVKDIVTIASIIEGEVSRPDDQPKVARAILNRLAAGMPLGVESAFRYGRLMVDGVPYSDPITGASQRDASLPYNIYIHPGLPATPIGNPGRSAMQAALNPADGNWIYWVTINLNTGETEFSSDEAGFNASVAKLRQWCSDNGNPAGCQ